MKVLGVDSQGIQKVMRKSDYMADMSGQFALGLVGNLVGQLTYFYTDKVGLAVGGVGIVMAIAKFVDALTDVWFGNVVEQSKGGNEKYYKWMLRMGGTELIRRKLGKDAYAMTITLLTDSQGKKMGKTAGNAVWLDPNKTSPFEFYQYWRNVGDADVMKCIRMLTFLPLEQIDEMATWKDQRLNEAKEILAYELTSMVHGKEEADKAQNAARALFSGAADTEHMPTTQLTEADLTDGSIGILTVMVKAGLAASNGEARRLVTQGGVLVDGEKVAAPTVSFTAEQLANGIVIKKGKKIYHKVTL